jgi:hypothetical protein
LSHAGRAAPAWALTGPCPAKCPVGASMLANALDPASRAKIKSIRGRGRSHDNAALPDSMERG